VLECVDEMLMLMMKKNSSVVVVDAVYILEPSVQSRFHHDINPFLGPLQNSLDVMLTQRDGFHIIRHQNCQQVISTTGAAPIGKSRRKSVYESPIFSCR
jgi:hypothetical protein